LTNRSPSAWQNGSWRITKLDKPWTPKKLEGPKEKKVAVVGAGPAGLTAALRLAQRGYPVTVFERLNLAGGMMAVGIPEYRLPRAILNKEIENIKRAGVEIKFNQELGKDFTVDGLLNKSGSKGGFSAVVLAIGAHKSRRLGIPGEDLPGVYHGTQFLKDVAMGKKPDMKGKSVAVVGGGAVAIDAARTALRLGAKKVHVIYRRTREEMPAWKGEIHAAFQEGVQFHFLTNPVGVLGPEHVTGVECHLAKLGEFDASGRRRPIPIEETEFEALNSFSMPTSSSPPLARLRRLNVLPTEALRSHSVGRAPSPWEPIWQRARKGSLRQVIWH